MIDFRKFFAFSCLVLLGLGSCHPNKDEILPRSGSRTILKNDVYSVFKDQPLPLNVLANDVIVKDGTLYFGRAAHGTISADSAGFFYRPGQNYVGPDQFYYRYCSSLVCDSALVRISVVDPAHVDPCVLNFAAHNDSTINSSVSGTAFRIEVLKNDIFCKTPAPTLTIISNPRYGLATVETHNGQQIIEYLKTNPPGSVSFTDNLEYRVSMTVNGQVISRSAKVKLIFN